MRWLTPKDKLGDLLAAGIVSVILFASVLVGVQAIPTAMRCHHDRGFLSWSGVRLHCTGEHVSPLTPLGG